MAARECRRRSTNAPNGNLCKGCPTRVVKPCMIPIIGTIPQGLLVTVTRLAGSSGRVLVDYATTNLVNTNALLFGVSNAVAGVDYTPVSGTLVFDDFEMSKTIVIPINSTRGGYNFHQQPA